MLLWPRRKDKIMVVESAPRTEFELDKAVYELGYELNNRPDWVKIPLQGVMQLLAT